MQRLTPTTPSLAYRVYGDEGPRVLMVMGFGMAGVMWRNQVEALSPTHQVATFDHRGLGASDTDSSWWTMPTLAHDTLRVADALGWSRFHLVGASMGGMIAQHVALAAPDRLESLTLMITQAGGRLAWLPPRSGLRVIAGLPRHRTPRARAEALGKLLYTNDAHHRVPPERMAQRADDMAAHAPPRATIVRQLHAILRHHTAHRLHEITTPTLVVQAARDRLVRPEHSERLADGLPHATLLRVGAAGHGLIVEAAEVVNQALATHIATHDDAAHQLS